VAGASGDVGAGSALGCSGEGVASGAAAGGSAGAAEGERGSDGVAAGGFGGVGTAAGGSGGVGTGVGTGAVSGTDGASVWPFFAVLLVLHLALDFQVHALSAVHDA
jgi:hypothetical protein